MFVPFSSRAKNWEVHGLALRGLARIRIVGLLDPWKLASCVGLRVLDGDAALSLLPSAEAIDLRARASDWSGGVYPIPLPDGSYLCILNPSHPQRRNKITLMEEISHTYLKHRPTRIAMQADGLRVRDYDHSQEADAYGVGAAALLPWSTFFQAIKSGASVESIAQAYDVTTKLVEYRIKTSGAYRLFRARQARAS